MVAGGGAAIKKRKGARAGLLEPPGSEDPGATSERNQRFEGSWDGCRAIWATIPLNPITPIRLGNTWSAFIRSPHAHTTSTRDTAPNGISRQYSQRYGTVTLRPRMYSKNCSP